MNSWEFDGNQPYDLLFKQEELYEYFDSLNTQQICN